MPIDLKDAAEENLSFIRGAMERAEGFSAVSGAGMVAMGFVGLCAMAASSRYTILAEQLGVWIASAFIATAIGVATSWFKSRRLDTTLFSDPGRRFLLCLSPILAVAALLTLALWDTPQLALLPWLWMMLYGCGLIASGTYAARPIGPMGGAFIVAGLFTYALPVEWDNLLLGTAFGGLHLVFGIQMFRHHGG